MSSYVVQSRDGLTRVDARSPRAAALLVAGTTQSTIVWYKTRYGWASWSEGPGRSIRYAGKVDERVAALLDAPIGTHRAARGDR